MSGCIDLDDTHVNVTDQNVTPHPTPHTPSPHPRPHKNLSPQPEGKYHNDIPAS